MSNHFALRLRKLLFSLSHPVCWGALRYGVAPAIEHFSTIKSLEIDGIIDVGANRGQFTLICSIARGALPIVAFEPIPAEAEVFQRVHRGRPQIRLMENALGNENGSAELHLSRHADSSSLLPVGEAQTRIFKGTEEVGTIKVPVRRLDDFMEDWKPHSRMLLKVDVQGFELNVLRGARETLRHCAYVYVECSEIPLYQGQALRSEVEAFLGECGFGLRSRFNECFEENRLVQADYLFACI